MCVCVYIYIYIYIYMYVHIYNQLDHQYHSYCHGSHHRITAYIPPKIMFGVVDDTDAGDDGEADDAVADISTRYPTYDQHTKPSLHHIIAAHTHNIRRLCDR